LVALFRETVAQVLLQYKEFDDVKLSKPMEHTLQYLPTLLLFLLQKEQYFNRLPTNVLQYVH